MPAAFNFVEGFAVLAALFQVSWASPVYFR